MYSKIILLKKKNNQLYIFYNPKYKSYYNSLMISLIILISLTAMMKNLQKQEKPVPIGYNTQKKQDPVRVQKNVVQITNAQSRGAQKH
ncbi:hypothetical protein pb186bvf_019914 [Paramecium bursaria]